MNVRVVNVSIRNKRKKKSPRSTVHGSVKSLAVDSAIDKKSTTSFPSSKQQQNSRNNLVLDHHQKHKKHRKKRVFFLLSCCLLLGLAILIILLLLLLKKQKTTRDHPIALLRWNQIGITVAGVTGVSGIDADKLNRPWDLAIVWPNMMYVTDRFNNRVQRFSLDSSTRIGVTVAGQANGTNSFNLDSLQNPNRLLVDTNYSMFILDTLNHRVLYWENNALNGVIAAGNGVYGSNLDELKLCYSLDYDYYSNVLFVGDHDNDRIMKYFRNSTSGILVAGGNGRGTNNTQLFAPHAVFFDNLSNSLLIANTGYHNILWWKLGDSNWTLAAGNINGTSGSTSTTFYSPTDVKLDPMGNMYVVDRYNYRIQFFSVGEKNGTTIAGINTKKGSNATMFYNPISLELDNQLNLYVTDEMNHRVQKFSRY